MEKYIKQVEHLRHALTIYALTIYSQFEAHVKGMLEQLFDVQDRGTSMDLLQQLPPKLVTLWGELETASTATTNGDGRPRAFQVEVDTPPAGTYGHEALIRHVMMEFAMNITFDGGSWASISGKQASIGSTCNSFLDNFDVEQHQKPYHYGFMEKDHTLATWCEHLQPGDEAYAKKAELGMHLSRGAKFKELTLEPEKRVRMNETQRPRILPGRVLPAASAAAQRAAAQNQTLNNSNNGDIAKEWASKALRDMKFSPATFHLKCAVNADPSESPRYGIDIPVTERVLVRLPNIVTRRPPLPDAAWGDLDVLTYAGLCIMHAAMRAGESLIENVSQVSAVKARVRVL